ncbi:MAG: oxidoreductase domain protein [Verrucomicrobiales bacterium]|nr:oxidoreductase domain protein [Verrucomicrobiales bacterium]
MKPLRFAILGTGFWARYQLAAWRELPGVECVAVCNRTRGKAETLAREFGVPAVYDDAGALLRTERLDFVDIITDPGTHRAFTELAARHGVPVICQKPMAESLDDARAMLESCQAAGVPLLIHENWRWQSPMRALAEVLHSGVIGEVFRARIDFVTSFPVFENQKFLAELPRFILADIGTHVLDTARFLFGEAQSLYATTRRVNPAIKGEDVATVMTTHGRCTVVTNMSYASRTEHERFPETFVFVEGSRGSAEITPGCGLRVTTASGTQVVSCAPPVYPWADPAYALVHASIVDCHRNLLAALRGEAAAETPAADNLRTLELVFAAYDSAGDGQPRKWPAL